MPYGGWMNSAKRGRLRVKKRFFRKYRKRYRKKQPFTRTLIGFPTNRVVKMRYSDQFVVNLATSVITINQVRANSIYEPEVIPGALSHKPLGYDQWGAFYERYVVIGSKIRVSAIVNNATTDMYFVGLVVNDSTPIATNVHDIIEQGNSTYSLISPANNGLVVNKTIIGKYSAKRFHNVKDVKDADTLEAAFGANPTDVTYFNIFAGVVDATLPATGLMDIQYTVDYIVMLKDAKELPKSA